MEFEQFILSSKDVNLKKGEGFILLNIRENREVGDVEDIILMRVDSLNTTSIIDSLCNLNVEVMKSVNEIGKNGQNKK